MIITRQPHDSGDPVGVFAVSVDPMTMDKMASVLAGIKWAELPEAKGGDISGAALSIEYVHGSKLVQREFNSWNKEFLEALKPVMSQLDSLEALMMKTPVRAIKISVARTKTGFAVTWLNIGTGDVVIGDPRTLKTEGNPATRGYVAVTALPASKPGVMTIYPRPTKIDLAPSAGALRPVTLAPGKPFTLDSVPWAPPAPGDYSAEAGWIDYDGADLPANAVMPTVPDPDHLNDKRPYRFRGAVFSGGGLYFTEEKPR
jgi:hypothetical protein